MTNFALFKRHRFLLDRSRICLCFFWLAGILSGCAFAMRNSSLFHPLMRGSVFQTVSIVGLLVSILLPLLFTWISLITGKPIIILIVCFIKAAAFAFCSVLIHQCYGNASWMVRFLYLFSDSCFLIILFSLWYWCLGTGQRIGNSILSFCSLIGVLLAAAELIFISPLILRVL